MYETLIAPPTEELIDIELAKLHMRVTDPIEDEYIQTLTSSSRLAAERFTGRAFVTQTWSLVYDGIENIPKVITLPKAPLLEIVSVTFFSVLNDQAVQTMTAGDYYVDGASDYYMQGRITPKNGKDWPENLREINALVIKYKAGYGTVERVPEAIVNAVLMLTAFRYEHREAEEEQIPQQIQMLLKPYSVDWQRWAPQ